HFEEELRIIPTGWAIAAVIGFAAIEVLFHVLIPSWSHHHDLPPQPWWTLLVILIPKPIGFVAYFLLRKPLLEPCPNCRWPIGSDFAYCPKCGHALAPSCNNCGRAIRRDYMCCPFCGKTVGGTAT